MDSEPAKAEKICRLVQRLKEVLADAGYEPLRWDTIEAAVAEYPGWAAFVENVRYARQHTYGWVASHKNPLAFSECPSSAEYAALFAVFEPYGILLDPVLDKSQKVERMEACIESNQAATFFWEDALDNPDPEIHRIAVEILEWIEAHRSLLRGAAAPKTDADELLRAAKPTEANAKNLLRSGGAPEALPPKPAGFWARLLRRAQ